MFTFTLTCAPTQHAAQLPVRDDIFDSRSDLTLSSTSTEPARFMSIEEPTPSAAPEAKVVPLCIGVSIGTVENTIVENI